VIDATEGIEGVQLAIAGAGRDRARLEQRARGRVAFLGRVPDADLPALYACADVFAMCCRDRWRGLEAEGFGIVFLEAAACGVPSVAGRSGDRHADSIMIVRTDPSHHRLAYLSIPRDMLVP